MLTIFLDPVAEKRQKIPQAGLQASQLTSRDVSRGLEKPVGERRGVCPGTRPSRQLKGWEQLS